MKYLLIGGAGFIGSWLTKYLTDLGHKVIIIDPLIQYAQNALNNQAIHEFRNKKLLNKAIIYKEKFEEIGEKILKKEKPQIVIHLAAFPLEYSFDSPYSLKQLTEDITLTYQIVSLVKEYQIKKFIFLSSISAYGNFDYTITETAPLHPTTVYGISKASGEFLIKSNLDNWIILRTTNVYGFGDLHNRSTNVVINKAIKGEKFWINDSIWLDFIYIKDLVEGVLKIISHAPVKEIFHISGGKAQKLSSFIKYLHPYFKLKYETKSLFDRPARGTMENSKARMLLNWSPKMDLEKGIKDYLKYVKKYNFA